MAVGKLRGPQGPEMTPRERVLAAINWRRPDRVPRINYISDNPLYRLGAAGLELLREFPSDGGEPPAEVPVRDPRFVGPDGAWRRVWTDEWGCTHDENLYGIEGIITRPPLADWADYPRYRLPPPPPHDPDDPEVRAERERILRKKKRYYVKVCFFRTFERLHFLHGMEATMLDLAAGEERLAELADRITEHSIAEVRWAAAVGADAVTQSDDWGTQTALLISPASWRQFFKPRYLKTFEVARELGLDVWFHSDGHIMEIIPDLAEIGVKVLNPQFSCHDLKALAGVLRKHRLAVLTDVDRQHLIPFGTPEQLRGHVREIVETFRAREGGLVGQAEFRGDVPLENIRAVFAAWREFGG
jgi:hypothetical protein